MKRSTLRVSDAAAGDILEQSDWYDHRSGRALATRWERAVTSALIRIAKNPGSGVRCHFAAAELVGLRRVAITRFPKHLVFYRMEDDQIVILRVIHGARNLEDLL